ncbi:MAG: hypothetical protein U0K19_04350 [Bifidobacteriaceae bacterium]|nr:hypothetical protein [Bifidobacteriaceae bacterium]
MTNREQRRTNERTQRQSAKNERPEASRSTTTQASLDQRARTVENVALEWRPGRVATITDADVAALSPDPMSSRRHSGWGNAKIVTWTVIVLSALAFIIVMWIPNLPMWGIVTVSAVFLAGVLSLFIVQSPRDVNPYVDENGTAV